MKKIKKCPIFCYQTDKKVRKRKRDELTSVKKLFVPLSNTEIIILYIQKAQSVIVHDLIVVAGPFPMCMTNGKSVSRHRS